MMERDPKIASNEEVEEKMMNNADIVLLDVREPEELALNHIPGAINMPLGYVEKCAGELNRENDMYSSCRTGNRSDMAAKILSTLAFKKVFNVIPGMIQWTGKTESSEE